MQKILNFLIAHYELIIFCAFFLIEFLIILFKKPVKVDSIKEKILKVLPLFISYAELFFTDPKSGSKKLALVVRNVKDYLSLKNDEYDSFIISEIERILSTPSKKMEKGEL